MQLTAAKNWIRHQFDQAQTPSPSHSSVAGGGAIVEGGYCMSVGVGKEGWLLCSSRRVWPGDARQTHKRPQVAEFVMKAILVCLQFYDSKPKCVFDLNSALRGCFVKRDLNPHQVCPLMWFESIKKKKEKKKFSNCR